MPERLLLPDEAAAFLRQAPKTLANWRVQGGGPNYLKFGRSVRYRQTDIDTWLADKKRSNTSDPGPAQRQALATRHAR